jgi:hypothetical protein
VVFLVLEKTLRQYNQSKQAFAGRPMNACLGSIRLEFRVARSPFPAEDRETLFYLRSGSTIALSRAAAGPGADGKAV